MAQRCKAEFFVARLGRECRIRCQQQEGHNGMHSFVCTKDCGKVLIEWELGMDKQRGEMFDDWIVRKEDEGDPKM